VCASSGSTPEREDFPPLVVRPRTRRPVKCASTLRTGWY
jgi:hypothetical protein